MKNITERLAKYLPESFVVDAGDTVAMKATTMEEILDLIDRYEAANEGIMQEHDKLLRELIEANEKLEQHALDAAGEDL